MQNFIHIFYDKSFKYSKFIVANVENFYGKVHELVISNTLIILK